MKCEKYVGNVMNFNMADEYYKLKIRRENEEWAKCRNS